MGGRARPPGPTVRTVRHAHVPVLLTIGSAGTPSRPRRDPLSGLSAPPSSSGGARMGSGAPACACGSSGGSGTSGTVVLSVAAGYARSGAQAAGRHCIAAACRRLLSRAEYNLQRLATAEQSWHPKDADLALTWWDLQPARTLAAGRYPAGAAGEAAGARNQALADLVVL
eukprot:g50106.t1